MYNMIFYISWWMDVNQACSNATSAEIGGLVPRNADFCQVGSVCDFRSKMGCAKRTAVCIYCVFSFEMALVACFK